MKSWMMSLLLLGSVNLVFAGQGSFYDFKWLDPDKKIYVLQNKVHEKEGTFHATIGSGFSMTQEFQDSLNFQFRLGYYFAEEWGVEGFYTMVSNSNNQAYDNVNSNGNLVPFVRRFNSHLGGMLLWSPFYGKVNTFNKIWYYDITAGIGAASVQSENNLLSWLNQAQFDQFDSESILGLAWSIKMRVYLTEWLLLTVDVFGISHMSTGDGSRKKNREPLPDEGSVDSPADLVNPVFVVDEGKTQLFNSRDFLIGLGITF